MPTTKKWNAWQEPGVLTRKSVPVHRLARRWPRVPSFPRARLIGTVVKAHPTGQPAGAASAVPAASWLHETTVDACEKGSAVPSQRISPDEIRRHEIGGIKRAWRKSPSKETGRAGLILSPHSRRQFTAMARGSVLLASACSAWRLGSARADIANAAAWSEIQGWYALRLLLVNHWWTDAIKVTPA